jgi:hypothetical protein
MCLSPPPLLARRERDEKCILRSTKPVLERKKCARELQLAPPAPIPSWELGAAAGGSIKSLKWLLVMWI